jgi:hypothetical protein
MEVADTSLTTMLNKQKTNGEYMWEIPSEQWSAGRNLDPSTEDAELLFERRIERRRRRETKGCTNQQSGSGKINSRADCLRPASSP